MTENKQEKLQGWNNTLQNIVTDVMQATYSLRRTNKTTLARKLETATNKIQISNLYNQLNHLIVLKHILRI